MRKPFFPDEFIDHMPRVARVSPDRLRSGDKSRIFVSTRAVIYMAMRERGLSFSKIARHFKRDHSTVIHAVQTFDRYDDDDRVQQLLRIARDRIQ